MTIDSESCHQASASHKSTNGSSLSVHALAGLPTVKDFLKGFSKITGVPVKILSECDLLRNYRGASAMRNVVVAPVMVDGKQVAVLVAGTACRARHGACDGACHGGKKRQSERNTVDSALLSPSRRKGIKELLELFARDLARQINHLPIAPHDNVPPCVTRARGYVRDHLCEPLTLSEVARHIGFCSDHFSRVFSQAMGVSFTEYLWRARVKKARELLADPNQRVTEVALASGFQSIPNFNRVFKRITGQTPTDYRELLHAKTTKHQVGFG